MGLLVLLSKFYPPGNSNTDLVKKKVLYEQFNVKQYFVVEPSDKTVLSFYLKDGNYTEPKKQKQNSPASSSTKLLAFNLAFHRFLLWTFS